MKETIIAAARRRFGVPREANDLEVLLMLLGLESVWLHMVYDYSFLRDMAVDADGHNPHLREPVH